MTSQPGPETAPALDAIMRERRQLINLAYRLLGSLADAEDAVQETYARWHAMSAQQQSRIDNPAAWLTRVAGRICLDVLGSARARREHYVGEWIPEPLPDPGEWLTGGPTDPADRVTLDESISMAFLIVLESMTPAERVAFILHDVFRYPFGEVATIVGRGDAACRQLASSARHRLPSSHVPANRQAELVKDFKTAWETKNLTALMALLDPEATVIADGGGLAIAVLEPLVGAATIAEYLLNLARRTVPPTILERTVNGRPCLVAQQDGVTVTVFAFGVNLRPHQEYLGSPEPREAPPLDHGLTHQASRTHSPTRSNSPTDLFAASNCPQAEPVWNAFPQQPVVPWSNLRW